MKIKNYTNKLVSEFLTEAYASPYIGKSEADQAAVFLAAARLDNVIDLEAFHKAFDDGISKIGLLNLFNDEGKLKHRGTYGDMKNYPDQNIPEIRALKKLWVLQFKDGLLTIEEKAKAEAKRQALEKQREEIHAREEQERLEKEAKAKAIREILDKEAEKLAPMLDQARYQELISIVPDPIMAKPRLVLKDSNIYTGFTPSADDKNNPNAYKFIYDSHPVDSCIDGDSLSSKALQDFVHRLNTLMPILVDEITKKNKENNDKNIKNQLLQHELIKSLMTLVESTEDGEFIIEDNNEYIVLYLKHGKLTKCRNLTKHTWNDWKLLSSSATLLGIAQGWHYGYGDDNYIKFTSFNSHLTPLKVQKALKWYDYTEGNLAARFDENILYTSFDTIPDKYKQWFSTDYGFDHWCWLDIKIF